MILTRRDYEHVELSTGFTVDSEFSINCDASFKEQKCVADIGIILYKNDEIIYQNTIRRSATTSMQAELIAIRESIYILSKLDIEVKKINLFSDNKSCISFINRSRIKKAAYVKYGKNIKAIAKLCKDIDVAFNWIPREQNRNADALSKGKKIQQIH